MPEDVKRTLKAFEMYRDEAAKCVESGAYLAGCVLLASALEAALMAMTQCFRQDVLELVRASGAREFSRPMKDWGLSQFLLVSRKLGWLPASRDTGVDTGPERVQVGDLVEVVRVVRNLVHPGIYLREYSGEPVTMRELTVSLTILDMACSCLSLRLGATGPQAKP